MAIFSVAALAEGQGRYAITGTNVKSKSSYQGTATLTKTGNMTWHMVENLGGGIIEGFGIGDGRVIAVSFATDAGTTLAVYVATADGSYSGMLAEEGDTDVSTETLKPQ